jgi:hypothetical protein
MTFTYEHPLVLQSGPQELKIAKITHGTTTVELSDGRVIWITIGVDSVKPNPNNKDAVDIVPSVAIEMAPKPEFPVADGPGTIQ